VIRALLIAACLFAALLPLPTRAQEADPVADARAHFERGVELFNEGRHDAALAEFTRAYAIAPAAPVLYNIARVHAALGHAVEATDTYERYLAEAGRGMNARRRREVTADLERQRARIAYLTVRTNVDGATLSVDGVDVATTPLSEPLRLAAGEHTIGARGAGHDASRRAVRLAGGDRETLVFELVPIVSARGTLRIESRVPDVEVSLDGQVVGRTPLATTIPTPEGDHVIVARREGYRERRIEVSLQGGAERVVDLAMEASEADTASTGLLRLRLPDAPALVHVDGEPTIPTAAGIRLPAGRHRLQLEVAEREPLETTVEVPAGEAIEVTPALQWTPDARAVRVSAADNRRTVGIALTVGGGAALLAGGSILLWNEGRIGDTDDRVVELNRLIEADECDRNPEDGDCPAYVAEGEALTEDQDAQQRARWVSLAVTGAGAVVALIGVVLWVTAPSDDGIDDDARGEGVRLRLRATGQGLRLDGTF